MRYRRILEIFCWVLVCAFVTVLDAKNDRVRDGVTPSFAEPPTPRTTPVLRWVKMTTQEFDPKSLAESLRNTKAIGLFTKLQLKGEIDDLVKEVKALNQGKEQATLAQLQERFQLLIHKIVTLLQDKDPKLAKSVTDARESLWQWLSDPNKSVTL